ncbi:MAG: hypothetical protein R3F21_16180 [Myxococcota bacterium]
MAEMHYAAPPILIHDVIDDLDRVRALLVENAPYTPLGGWYSPNANPDAATSALWFQQDWVHADHRAPGSDLFLQCPRYFEASRTFYDAEVILPHSLYVNVMAGLEEHGPAHTDNPKFRGRERKNTPMWLLRSMLWSGLFIRWEIVQSTAIWWLNDVEEGGLAYWAEGPDEPPRRHFGRMANTALIGDNHRMFHQVEPVGPFGGGTRRVTPRAQLAPAADDPKAWTVQDRGREVFRAPLSDLRVSVLWKADVYGSEAERREVERDRLSLEDVARIFDADFAVRGEKLRFDLERLEDPAFAAQVAAVYPEARPIGAGKTIYDAVA